MLKFTKKHARLLTLAIAVAMIVAAMLAIPASAHIEDGCFIYELNGEAIVCNSTRAVPTCRCSTPNIEDYRDMEEDDHKPPKIQDHLTYLVQVCTNCKEVYFYYGICVGGCAPYCYLPGAPDWVYSKR